MRLRPITIGMLFVASIALVWGTEQETPSSTFYLASGEEVQAKPTAVNGNILLVEAFGRARKLPLFQIVAVKSGGDLSNGPFDAPRLREILGLPAPIAEASSNRGPSGKDTAGAILTGPSHSDPASATAPSVSADTGEAHYGPEYYVYGQAVSLSYLAPLPGQAPMSSGTVTKVFTRCVTKDGKENCGSPRWIGLFGEDLSSALAQAPEAKATADRIKTSTTIQGLSLVALPFFFFPAISLANEPADEYGRVHTHVGPASMILFGLTGAAFANYIGWNIYEGVLARKAIRIYNQKMGVNVSAAPAPSGAVLAADIEF